MPSAPDAGRARRSKGRVSDMAIRSGARNYRFSCPFFAREKILPLHETSAIPALSCFHVTYRTIESGKGSCRCFETSAAFLNYREMFQNICYFFETSPTFLIFQRLIPRIAENLKHLQLFGIISRCFRFSRDVLKHLLLIRNICSFFEFPAILFPSCSFFELSRDLLNKYEMFQNICSFLKTSPTFSKHLQIFRNISRSSFLSRKPKSPLADEPGKGRFWDSA